MLARKRRVASSGKDVDVDVASAPGAEANDSHVTTLGAAAQPISSAWILSLLLTTRLAVLLLANVAHKLAGSYDVSADHAAELQAKHAGCQTAFWSLTQAVLQPLYRWDSVHLLAVADTGYMHEFQAAFLPLFPAMSAASAKLCLHSLQLLGLSSVCNQHLLLMSGIAINFVASYTAAILLGKLTAIVCPHDPRLVRIAVLLFILSPATIFLTAPYTEAAYATLVFGAYLALENSNHWQGEAELFPMQCKLQVANMIVLGAATICFTIASACRSNGITNVIYLLYFADNYHRIQISKSVATG